MAKKILITGGAGFIGSNFIRYIYDIYPDYQIYNFDLLTYAGNPDNLLSVKNNESKKNKKRYFFIKGDICNRRFVDKTLKKYKPDIVINFAAESHVDRSIIDSRYFFRTNLIGVHSLIDQVVKNKISRFVQISTDEIYGDVLKGESHELSSILPSNPYAASKASADLLVQTYIRTHKLPALIVRGSNNFGPFQYPEKLIPLSITNLLENKKIPIHGDGLQKRRWIHVLDFCRGIDLVMHKGKNFSIYNVSGEELTNIQIVKLICKTLKRNFKKSIEFVNDRPGGDRRYAANSDKIKKDLGWRIKYPAQQYISSVVEWYLENESWWKKIKMKKEYKVLYKKQYTSQY